MAYVTIKDFNTQLGKIGEATLFTKDNTNLDTENLKRISGNLEKFDFVDFMTALSYKAPAVALSTSLSTLVYELGIAVHGGQTLTAAVSAGSSPIVSVEFFKNDNSVSLITADVAAGGNFTYASGTDITTNETYKVVVTCEDGATSDKMTWSSQKVSSTYGSHIWYLYIDLMKARGGSALPSGVDNTKTVFNLLLPCEILYEWFSNTSNNNRFGIPASYGDFINYFQMIKHSDNSGTVLAAMSSGKLLSRRITPGGTITAWTT